MQLYFIHRNLLSEYDEFEKEITDQHAVLQLQSSKADSVHKSQTQSSLQSLSSSFEDLQQRYKQLKEECANKIGVSAYHLELGLYVEHRNRLHVQCTCYTSDDAGHRGQA